MLPAQWKDNLHFGQWRVWLPWTLLAIVIFLVAAWAVPKSVALYWYPGIKSLFYEDVGLSEGAATLLALGLSFLYASVWLPFLRWSSVSSGWRLRPKRIALGLLAVIALYGLTPIVHLLYGGNVCFNQRTGEPRQWYVIEPGGNIARYDSAGFDVRGVAKRPVTMDICRIAELQKRGIRAQLITVDPRQVKYFDEQTGYPRVWWAAGRDGSIELFDAEGVSPSSGEPLRPITNEIARLAQQQVAQSEAETARIAHAKAADSEREKRDADRDEKARALDAKRKELTALFGVSSYADDVVLVGVQARKPDDASGDAARLFLAQMTKVLQNKGARVSEIKPAIYGDEHFGPLLQGDTSELSQTGLLPKLKAARFAHVAAGCNPSTIIPGAFSCTVSARVRLLSADGTNSLSIVSDTGAAATTSEALRIAIQSLSDKNPELWSGV